MSKTVTLADLAADLPAHVHEVKGGETLTIVENGQAIATITPTIAVHGVRYPFRGFDFGPRPAGLKSDPAAVIIDDRERERSGKKYGL
jgi:antitoxin (DNA-binding transcriptional repressor) of toxin-antitoxin stability system